MIHQTDMVQGFIMAAQSEGWKFVKADGVKLYFEIPTWYPQEKIDRMKTVLNSQMLRLFTKRV